MTLLLLSTSAKPSGAPFWMPFDPATFELGDLLADAQLMKIGRAWKIPLILAKRAKRIREFFKG